MFKRKVFSNEENLIIKHLTPAQEVALQEEISSCISMDESISDSDSDSDSSDSKSMSIEDEEEYKNQEDEPMTDAND